MNAYKMNTQENNVHENNAHENNEKELLTPKEATQLLGICMATLWIWVKQGRIKKYALTPRSIRYKRSELLALIDASAV